MPNCNLNKISASDSSIGRSADIDMSTGLQIICNWLEEDSDFELYTLNELQEKIEESGSKCYPNTRLKQKSEEKYGEHIVFSENFGRSDIVCFKEFAISIVREKKKEQNVTEESIIEAAAKIRRSEIREIPKSNEQYPKNIEIQDIEKTSE